MRLRILVYNVRGFRAGVAAVAAAVEPYAPDVALLNECRSRGRLRRFARAVAMQSASPRWFPLSRTPRNAVLVRPPGRIVEWRVHRFGLSKRFYPRGALMAHIGRTGHRVWTLSVHLGLAPGERRRHAEELLALTRRLNGPLLVGGDLNEGPDGDAVAWFADRMWDAWPEGGEGPGGTFPSADPTHRIDYLFRSEHFVVESAIVGGPEVAGASDHRPLFVDLVLR
jgi:endonuclease/exonuclease/phosphatase family metal-dependent hydrolase